MLPCILLRWRWFEYFYHTGIDFVESAVGETQPLRQTMTTSRTWAVDGDEIIHASGSRTTALFACEFGLLNWGWSINCTALRFSHSRSTPYTISLPYQECLRTMGRVAVQNSERLFSKAVLEYETRFGSASWDSPRVSSSAPFLGGYRSVSPPRQLLRARPGSDN
jgi:hypothetical protein